MKDYEDEAFDEIEKAQQRKVAHGVTDGSLWRKRHEPSENREQIIAWAREAGFVPPDGIFVTWDASDEQIERFAQLVAAAPELLEALQFVMTAHGEQLSTAFEQAQAAIAKANGEGV